MNAAHEEANPGAVGPAGTSGLARGTERRQLKSSAAPGYSFRRQG